METKVERVLHPYGDIELFYAEAESKEWMLPLHVEWHEDRGSGEHFARVAPAGICLYPTQTLALNALLQFHDIQGRPNQWVISRRICEALLHKSPGITVMRYYRWPSETIPPIEDKPPLRTAMQQRGPATHEKNRGNDPKRRSFVEWLAKDTKISSSIINAVLNAVATGAPTWMLERRKPLDLGFVRLIAVPFRANWKEIVAFKAKAGGIKLGTLLNLPDDRRWTMLEEAGLPEMMASPHNVGLRRGWNNDDNAARIDYTIEAIASTAFEFAANRAEAHRIARGPAAYVAEFEDAVEAVYESAVLALHSYLKKVGMPFAQVGNGRDACFLGFLQVGGRSVAVRGTPLNRIPVHIVDTGTRFSVFGKADDPHLLPPPPAEVQEVPALLQEPSDVRERTVDGDFHIIDGGDRADGLSVLSSSEGRAEGESVLPEPAPAGAGVAEGDPVI